MTVGEALRSVRIRLEGAGIESADAEAWLLLEMLLQTTRAELLLHRTTPLTEEQLAQLEAWLRRRETREPLQHILSVAHFYGLTLRVTPEVLVPRPETEVLVELGLGALRGRVQPQVLEVGTGSGAIALALKAERPDATVWATDISGGALEVAKTNARDLVLDVHFVAADLLDDPNLQTFARSTDLLIANLPYLPESDVAGLSPEVQRDPPGALFSGEDGLGHFRRLEAQAVSLLPLGAVALFELDPRNVEEAERESGAWRSTSLHRDLTGRLRFLRLTR